MPTPESRMGRGFRLCKRKDVAVVVCDPLDQAGFVHAFSTRQGGVSPLPDKALNLGYFSGDSAERVVENRRRFLDALGGQEMTLITGKQIHSDGIAVIDHLEDSSTSVGNCDALITNVTGLLLGVQTADCVPLLIADMKRRLVAAVHAGWRGTLARVTEKTISRLRVEFGTQPGDCLAAIGPSAGGCCYEVESDVIDPFCAEFTDVEAFLSYHHPHGKAHLDLPVANAQQLLRAGLDKSHVLASGLCTMCRNDLFFSHRLEHERGVGRMLSIIGVRG